MPSLDPLDPSLNAAVLTMAGRLFPTGFDTVQHEASAPSDLDTLNLSVAMGRMVVWAGASDTTIFGSPDVNHAFRAWHDWCHWRYQLPMDAKGEAACAYVQIAHLIRVYGPTHPKLMQWAQMILVEVIGQNLHAETFGSLPEDQRGYHDEMTGWYKFTAARVLGTLRPNPTDDAAIKLAGAYYGRTH